MGGKRGGDEEERRSKKERDQLTDYFQRENVLRKGGWESRGEARTEVTPQKCPRGGVRFALTRPGVPGRPGARAHGSKRAWLPGAASPAPRLQVQGIPVTAPAPGPSRAVSQAGVCWPSEWQPHPLRLPVTASLAMQTPPEWEAVPDRVSTWVTHACHCVPTWQDQSSGD